MPANKPVLEIVVRRALDSIANAVNEADIAYHEVFGLGAVDGIDQCNRAAFTRIRGANEQIRRAAINRRLTLRTPTAIDRG